MGKYFEVQSKLILKNHNFQSFSRIRKDGEVKPEQHLKIPVCDLFRNWEKLGNTASWRPRFQSPNFESIDELEKVISKFKFHCWK